MPDTHSKIAAALTLAALNSLPAGTVLPVAVAKGMADAIDERLAQIREAYKPEELARCPVVTHHGDGPCAFCNTAAMRAFILLPEQL